MLINDHMTCKQIKYFIFLNTFLILIVIFNNIKILLFLNDLLLLL